MRTRATSSVSLYLVLLGAALMGLTREALAFSPSTHHSAFTSRRRHNGPSASSQLNLALDPHAVTDFYSQCLTNHPLPTQSATAGVFGGLGDALAQTKDLLVAQRSNSKKFKYNPTRTFHYVLKGLGGGIMWSYWFQLSDPLSNSLLHMLLPEPASAADVVSDPDVLQSAVQAYSWTAVAAIRTVLAILLEQFLFCPLIYAAWDIPLIALLAGSNPKTLPRSIQTKLPPLLVANAKVWTPVNVITYNLPAEWRVLFTSAADIVWQSVNSATLAAGTSKQTKSSINGKDQLLQQQQPSKVTDDTNNLVPKGAAPTTVV